VEVKLMTQSPLTLFDETPVVLPTVDSQLPEPTVAAFAGFSDTLRSGKTTATAASSATASGSRHARDDISPNGVADVFLAIRKTSARRQARTLS
jgi:hypothetical protein